MHSGPKQRCISFHLYPAQKYKDAEPSLKIKEVDGLELVKKFSEDMETMLRRKVEAVEVTLSLPQHWPGDPFRDSTDSRWSSPGWVGFMLSYTNKVTTGVRGDMSYKEEDTSRSQPGFVNIQGRGYLSNSEQPWRVDPHG